MNNELKKRIINLNNKMLNIVFILSFNKKLSKINQKKLRKMESELNDLHYKHKKDF